MKKLSHTNKSINTLIVGIILLIIAFAVFACNDKPTAVDTYHTMTIDNCEYIYRTNTTHSGYQVVSFTHKGNCINPIHQCK